MAYLGLRIWSLTVRPSITGVKCILTNGDRILLVRHTYGPPKWDLPGGTARRGEPPAETARREMSEELGVKLDGLVEIGTFSARIDRRNDIVHCFHAEIADQELTIDLGEIEQVGWFSLDHLPPNAGRHARTMVALLGPAMV